jgi:hypothetical protein
MRRVVCFECQKKKKAAARKLRSKPFLEKRNGTKPPELLS